MSLFWFHVTLISTSILLAFGMAGRLVFHAQVGDVEVSQSLAIVPAAVGAVLVLYLWHFVRRRGIWKQ